MCIKHKKNYFMWYATVLGWRISCRRISEVTKTTLSLRIWMVEILCTVLFDRFLLLARAEGQTETQDTERYFCIILFLLFTIQDVKCKSLTWDLKKKSPCYFSSNYVQYYEDTFQFVESITANTCWQSELKIQKLYFTVTAHNMSFKGLSFHPWCFSCGISFISIQIEKALEGGKQKVGDRCQRLIWNSNIYFLFRCLIH